MAIEFESEKPERKPAMAFVFLGIIPTNSNNFQTIFTFILLTCERTTAIIKSSKIPEQLFIFVFLSKEKDFLVEPPSN